MDKGQGGTYTYISHRGEGRRRLYHRYLCHCLLWLLLLLISIN